MKDYEKQMAEQQMYGGLDQANPTYCVPPPMAPKNPEPILSRLMMLEDAMRKIQAHLEKLWHVLDETRKEIGLSKEAP